MFYTVLTDPNIHRQEIVSKDREFTYVDGLKDLQE